MARRVDPLCFLVRRLPVTDRTGNEVRIEVAVDDAEAEEVDHLTASLRRELLRLDVDGQHSHILVFQATLRNPCARQPAA